MANQVLDGSDQNGDLSQEHYQGFIPLPMAFVLVTFCKHFGLFMLSAESYFAFL